MTTRNEMLALADCPLCHSAGETLLRGWTYPGGKGSSEKHDEIMCPTCGCRAPLKAWNARTAAPAAGVEQRPVAWRHKHFPNEPWQYRVHQTFGTSYPYYEPLYAAPLGALPGRQDFLTLIYRALAWGPTEIGPSYGEVRDSIVRDLDAIFGSLRKPGTPPTPGADSGGEA